MWYYPPVLYCESDVAFNCVYDYFDKSHECLINNSDNVIGKCLFRCRFCRLGGFGRLCGLGRSYIRLTANIAKLIAVGVRVGVGNKGEAVCDRIFFSGTAGEAGWGAGAWAASGG